MIILQVLGDGNKRILTLTHRCQVKRFFNDLVRILKNKPQRSMAISEIPKEFSKNILEYHHTMRQESS